MPLLFLGSTFCHWPSVIFQMLILRFFASLSLTQATHILLCCVYLKNNSNRGMMVVVVQLPGATLLSNMISLQLHAPQRRRFGCSLIGKGRDARHVQLH